MPKQSKSNNVIYQINKFDPTSIESTSIVLLIGPRGTGKSVLQNDLMYHLRDRFSFGVAMTPTKDTMDAWKGKIPRSCIYEKYRQSVVEELLAIQDRGENDNRKLHNLFLLLDDCMFEKKLLASDCMRELFMNGRHKNVFFMNTVQYMMDTPPQIRGCIDYVFVLKDSILTNRKRLYEYFFGIFPSLADFNRTMTTCTADYQCMVFCKKGRTPPGASEKLEHSIFWYKGSKEIPHFRMCRPVFWYLTDFYEKANNEKGRFSDTNSKNCSQQQTGVILNG